MKIGVIGGTGRIGALVVEGAVEAGHQVLSISRRASEALAVSSDLSENPASQASLTRATPPHIGVRHVRGDITESLGLAALVEECDVIYDLVDARTNTQRLGQGARNLVAAAERSDNQPTLVNLAIINSELSSFGYYQSKSAQAEVYRSYAHGRVLEAAQFFSFMDMIFDAGRRAGVIPWVTGSSFQPVSESDVASELLQAVDGVVPHAWRLVGPELLTSKEAAIRYRVSTRSRRILLPVRIPGDMGRFYRVGQHIDTTAPTGSARYRANGSLWSKS